MIGVIDYQTGNSRSVIYALQHLGVPGRLVETPADCSGVERYILPGVGSAGVTMNSLRELGWIDHLNEKVVGEGRYFLGICVGLQVLFAHSEEGDVDCLGWIPGQVRHFDAKVSGRVPHMGWNEAAPSSGHPFVRDVPVEHYYFVNSYYVVPDRAEDSAATTSYGNSFTSVAARGNIMGTQFHAEKSGEAGLRLLRRFAALNKEGVNAEE